YRYSCSKWLCLFFTLSVSNQQHLQHPKIKSFKIKLLNVSFWRQATPAHVGISRHFNLAA
ncbi:TPA: hypothetical protein ACIBGX_003869, partial [Salmonella enterica subsp. enterica serovar Montevideo]